uniref:F-box/FBD/LRR-repeat protein At1g13570 isoform X2 n=1 Tax=Elaeis guineensis var. tenera TaxID=51953 RepID=A0A8N4F676_ELAGV|nr:F-box/FBD/LRR-repeat protein At1g13570 isoform X2 [Elaeis guineensis]
MPAAIKRRRDDEKNRISRPGMNSDGGVGEGEGPDFISLLPDCILITHILSLLPAKECARTSILSCRWCHVWTLVPLHLDDFALRREKFPDRQSKEAWGWHEGRDWCVRAVNQILSVHRGPILSFHIPRFYVDLDWLQTFAQRGIQYLNLTSCDSVNQLTPSILRCKTIRALKLPNFDFLKPPVTHQPIFINVKQLILWGVGLTDETVHHLLASCLALQLLSLFMCSGLRRLRISSPSIPILKLYSNYPVEDIVVEDAPDLERMMLYDASMRCITADILNAPKLEFIYVRLKNFELAQTHFELKSSNAQLIDSAASSELRLVVRHEDYVP